MPHRIDLFSDELAASGQDLPKLLDLIATRVSEVVGEASVLTVLSDDGRTLEPVAVHHPDPELQALLDDSLRGQAIPVGEGMAGLVATDRRPVRLAGLSATMAGRLVSEASRRYAERYPVHAMMVVPLIAYGEVLGTLGVSRSDDVPYDDHEVELLEVLARRAALALADARGRPPSIGPAEYEAIFRHSLDGVLFTIPDGTILAANPAACEILQRSEAEICRLGRARLLDGDDPRTQALLEQRAVVGRARAEVPMIRPDGSRFVAEVSSTVFLTDAGQPRTVVIFRDVDEQVTLREQLRGQSERLEQLAQEDPLTGLLNRRGFEAAAERELAYARRAGAETQLVFFDLDGLKSINDRLGHRAGDEAIKRFGEAIAAELRETDALARLGGDEFVALLFDARAEHAQETIDRVDKHLAQETDGGPVLSFSAGIAGWSKGSQATVDEVLAVADHHMYQQKILRRLERHRRSGRAG